MIINSVKAKSLNLIKFSLWKKIHLIKQGSKNETESLFKHTASNQLINFPLNKVEPTKRLHIRLITPFRNQKNSDHLKFQFRVKLNQKEDEIKQQDSQVDRKSMSGDHRIHKRCFPVSLNENSS